MTESDGSGTAGSLVFRTFVAWALVRAEGRQWPVLGPA